MPKIGITGSRTWENKLKLKNAIFSLKNKYKSSLDIISGGTNEALFIWVRSCLDQQNVGFEIASSSARTLLTRF